MAKAKVIGETSGNHLKITLYSDGTAKMKWNWKVLLEEVQAATAAVKQDLVTITEEKIKKTRTKKVETQITDAVTSKPKRTKKTS